MDLAELLSDMGDASRFNLETALRAAALEGVGGQLIINVPRKVGARVDIDWIAPAAPAR